MGQKLPVSVTWSLNRGDIEYEVPRNTDYRYPCERRSLALTLKTLNASVSKTIPWQIGCVAQGPPTFMARDPFTTIVDSKS